MSDIPVGVSDLRDYGLGRFPDEWLDGIDEGVLTLVGILNTLPGITTSSSCEGHPDPVASQAADDEFYVTFYVDRDAASWDSLDLLSWACERTRGDDAPGFATLKAKHEAPQFGLPVRAYDWYPDGLAFKLAGCGGYDPDVVAQAIVDGMTSRESCEESGGKPFDPTWPSTVVDIGSKGES